MRNFTTVLKIAPAFLLAGTLMHAQTTETSDSTKENKIEEVVLIGYGSKKKSDLTGSVTAVTEKDFNKGAIVSADQLIQGKAPGVRITNDGGSPDSAPNIRIRGGSSLSASNNPLIVIDGVPIASDNPAGNSNPLSLVNPNDIESFSILKDASATAIYGSRASNGVIIIKTKRGTKKLRINFNTQASVGEVIRYADVMEGSDFVDFIKENYPQYTYRLGVGGDISNPLTPGQIYETDWQKQIYRNSVSTDNILSISGSVFDRKLPIRLSLGYNRSEGVVKTDDFERISTSLNLTPSLWDDHLKIDINAKGIFIDKNSIDAGATIGAALNMDPTKPVYLNQTNLSGDPYNRFGGYYQQLAFNSDQYQLQGPVNPLAALMQRRRPEDIKRFLGNAEFTYKFHFLPDLKAVANLGLETSESTLQTIFSESAIATYRNRNQDPDNPAFQYTYPNDYQFNPGVDYAERQKIFNKLMDTYLVYEKKMSGFISNFLIQGGYSYQNFENDGTKDLYRYNNITGTREVNPGSFLNPNNRYYIEHNLQSFFGRTNVDILDKYLITASLRADASSFFKGSENQWGYFPSVAFAWKMHKDLFPESTNVRDLKLRLGWGETGNQNISGAVGYYPSSAYFEIGDPNSQYFPGITTYSALPFNEDVTWETTETFNAGLDFAFFPKDRIAGSLDVYQRKTRDLLSRVPLAPGQGLTNDFIKNVGNLENKGVELNINTIPVMDDELEWSIGGNFAYNIGEITYLENTEDGIPATESGLPMQTGLRLARHQVGYEPYSAWVFQQVYDNNGNPLPDVFVDQNNDGIINESDAYYEPMRPNWTYGFNTILNYKNWDFNAAFRGQIGGKVYNTRIAQQGFKNYAVPQNVQNLNNVVYYAASSPFEQVNDYTYLSDYFLEDASFLKFDNFTVGYLINNAFKSMDLRIFGSVNNVYTFTKFNGQDPENFNGIDNNFYPRPRTYTIGFNFNF